VPQVFTGGQEEEQEQELGSRPDPSFLRARTIIHQPYAQQGNNNEERYEEKWRRERPVKVDHATGKVEDGRGSNEKA
jgi:hypothetical protein